MNNLKCDLLFVILALHCCVLPLCVGGAGAPVSLLPFDNVNFILSKTPRLTEICLECFCDDYRGVECDVNDLCGSQRSDCDLLGISRSHWFDGGNHTITKEDKLSPYAYVNCKRDPDCSARTVQGYLTKFEKDCNMNRSAVYKCIDYAAIYFYGFDDQCQTKEIHSQRRSRFESCLQNKGMHVITTESVKVNEKQQSRKQSRNQIGKQKGKS